MALINYIKTIFNNNAEPGISAEVLNNNEDQTYNLTVEVQGQTTKIDNNTNAIVDVNSSINDLENPILTKYTKTTDDKGDGELYYSDIENTLVFNDSKYNQELVLQVINLSGADIAAGKLVKNMGLSNGIVSIQLAQADTDINSKVIGFTKDVILDGAVGFIVYRGLLKTNYTFEKDDYLYLSEVDAGGVTTEPGARKVFCGVGVTTDTILTDIDFSPLDYNPTEPTGFDRLKMETLPHLELCTDDINSYSRIYYDIAEDKMKKIEISAVNTFGDGVTPLALNTFAMVPNNNEECYYVFYNNKINITTKTITLSQESGGHVIFLDIYGNLNEIVEPDKDEIYDIITKQQIVSIVTGNVAVPQVVLFADEMHGIVMDSVTHAAKHLSDGCKYGDGLLLSGVSDNSGTYTGISAGSAWDEDIKLDIDSSTTNRFLYREGIDGAWRQSTVKDNNLGLLVGGEVKYNNDVGDGSWTLESIGTNYVIMHFLSTNNLGDEVVKVVGQNIYASRTEARKHLDCEISQLSLSGLPSPEFVFLYSMIIHNESVGQIETGTDGEIYVDHRFGYPASRF